MSPGGLRVLIPLGGEGRRFAEAGHAEPKPLVPVASRPLLRHLLDRLLRLEPAVGEVWVVCSERLAAQLRGAGAVPEEVGEAGNRAPLRLVTFAGERTCGAAETVLLGLRAMAAAGEAAFASPCGLGSAAEPPAASRVAVMDGDAFYLGDVLERVARSEAASGVVFFRQDSADAFSGYSYLRLSEGGAGVLAIREKERVSDWANTGLCWFASASQLAEFAQRVVESGERFRGEAYMSLVISAMLRAGVPFAGLRIRAREMVCLGTPAQVRAYVASAPALLFDLDGTLADTEPLYRAVWRSLLREAGVAEEAEADAAFGELVAGRDDAAARAGLVSRFGSRGCEERAEQSPFRLPPLAALSAEKDARFVAAARAAPPSLLPGARELLIRARRERGALLALVSNANRRAVEAVVRAAGLGGLFHAVVVGPECALPKPSPEPYLAAARALGVDPARAIVFEDSETGLRSARAAGAGAVVRILGAGGAEGGGAPLPLRGPAPGCMESQPLDVWNPSPCGARGPGLGAGCLSEAKSSGIAFASGAPAAPLGSGCLSEAKSSGIAFASAAPAFSARDFCDPALLALCGLAPLPGAERGPKEAASAPGPALLAAHFGPSARIDVLDSRTGGFIADVIAVDIWRGQDGECGAEPEARRVSKEPEAERVSKEAAAPLRAVLKFEPRGREGAAVGGGIEEEAGSLSAMARRLRLYEREYQFYGGLRDAVVSRTRLRVPECHGIVLGPDGSPRGVLLERLSAPAFVPALDLNAQPFAVAARVVERLAEMHARFRGCGAEFPFLRRPDDALFLPSWGEFAAARWDAFAARWAGVLSPAQLARGAALARGFEQTQRALAAEPAALTLIHGDAKSANIFYRVPEGFGGGAAAAGDGGVPEPYFIDWQYIALGRGAQDLAFLIIESLDEAHIAEWTGPLCEVYLSAAEATGPEAAAALARDLALAAGHFPLFVALWFGTLDPASLSDPAFPERFVRRLFAFLDRVQGMASEGREKRGPTEAAGPHSLPPRSLW